MYPSKVDGDGHHDQHQRYKYWKKATPQKSDKRCVFGVVEAQGCECAFEAVQEVPEKGDAAEDVDNKFEQGY